MGVETGIIDIVVFVLFIIAVISVGLIKSKSGPSDNERGRLFFSRSRAILVVN